MYVEQLYTGCLAEAAYYIESEGQAAIIDPLREIAPYLELAQKRGATVKYIFETHFHADFVSGHLDLAAKTGATIVFGPTAKPAFSAYIAEDNELFNLGNVQIKTLHTPGHTMESSTFLLIDEEGNDHAIFTGDTLFIGDVGRPDLAVKTDLTMEDLAGHLYDSLQNKILPLANEVVVYPGHGAGSQCGKHMSNETVSTLGQQRQFNYALQPMDKAKFIEVVTDGLSTPPAYFPENARINKTGYENIEQVLQRNTQPLTVSQMQEALQQGAILLDTRTPDSFEKGFIPGALNIGLNGQYAVWVGSLVKFGAPMVVVAEPGQEAEAILRLARVGFENVKGFLQGGVQAWQDAGNTLETVSSVTAQEALELKNAQGFDVLDVRRNTENDTERVEGSLNIALMDLEESLDQLDKNTPYLVHCAGGYRSMIAASILKQNGFTNFKNVYGGFKAMKEVEGMPVATGMCPTQRRKAKLETA